MPKLDLQYSHSDQQVGPVLEVDLEGVRQNWRKLDELCPKSCTGAVVKANAYGLDMQRVAPSLFADGCRHFFTAYVSEAVSLRKLLGPSPEIFVFNGAATTREHHACAEEDLCPLLNTPQQVKAWVEICEGSKAAIMIDTGMNRLGLREPDIKQASDRLNNTPIPWVMSHLACADEPNNPMNLHQLNEFLRLASFWPDASRSLSNTAGICLGEDYQLDLVRPGIGLYGAHTQSPFHPTNVATLSAPIISVTHINETSPTTVGYGSSAHVHPAARIAVAAIGYADGLQRSLSNKGKARVHEVDCPIIGRVSMDLIMIDITGTPATTKVGDNALIFGADLSIEEQADRAGTISYELLTSIGPRVSRRYINAATESGANLS